MRAALDSRPEDSSGEVVDHDRPHRRPVPVLRVHYSPTAFLRAAGFLAAGFFAADFLAADFPAAGFLGAGSTCFLAAATDALRASIRSTTLAVGSAATTSISCPLSLASTICRSPWRYSSEN